MKRIVFFIGTTILIVVGYIYYEYNYRNIEIDVWSFVPANALGVYESPSIIEDYNHIKEVNILPPSLRSEYLDVFYLDKEDSSTIAKKFANTRVLISTHTITNEAVDFVYYLDLRSGDKASIAQDYINKLVKKNKGRLVSRTYQDKEIIEVMMNSGSYSYFIEEGVLVFTQTAFLLEDVIRVIAETDRSSYEDNHRDVLSVAKLKNDQGDLYINTDEIGTFFKMFVDEDVSANIANSTFLDVKVADDLISMNGFTYSSGDDYLSTIQDQQPVAININNYIPNNSNYVFHVGFDKQSLWLEAQKDQFGTVDTLKPWDTGNSLKWIGSELALVSLNVEDIDDKLLLIGTKDVNESLNQLNKLNEYVTDQKQDSIFYESYGGVLIKELVVNEFPKTLFGNLYEGFPISYYAIIDDYVAITNTLEVMHELINSIEQENTWGRTLGKSQWLSQTLQESNVSFYFDYTQAKNLVNSLLNETWKEGLKVNQAVVKGLGMGAIQFSNIDGKYYTNIVLEYDSKYAEPEVLNFYTEHTTFLNEVANTKPFVVRNHLKPKAREIFIQDSLNNIYLIDDKGSIAWQDSIGEDIVGTVHQIDYYKNKKLQYLFASSKSIYLLDRNGNTVENYPMNTNIEIDNISVFDYDRTKNYRILVSGKGGDLYMYDKEGNNLKGWNPRKMLAPLITAPRHIRVRGKDIIVAIQANGEIVAMNRRGELYGGFPVKAGDDISGDVHLSIGRDFSSSLISVISPEGELVQFDLNGTEVRKKQFLKPTKDTFFQLVNGVTKSDFVIVRQNAFRLSIVDMNEELILEKDYLNKETRNLQYYDLGNDEDIFVINDFTQGFGYIYDHTGKLMNNVPINNNYQIGLMKNNSAKKTMIYTAYEDQVTVYSY